MIADDEFQSKYKQQAKDFVRERILTFPKVVVGLINLMNRSLAVELAKLLNGMDWERHFAASKPFLSSVRSLNQQPLWL